MIHGMGTFLIACLSRVLHVFDPALSKPFYLKDDIQESKSSSRDSKYSNKNRTSNTIEKWNR
jgi:hypothetical protein